MAVSETQQHHAGEVDDVNFPPGTVRLSDLAHSHLVLAPQPTSDPNDPLNWSSARKYVQITILSFYGIFVYGLLTVSVPLWQVMNAQLGFTYPQLNNSYGVSAATLSFGCVCFTPFALRYGRRPVYIVTSLLMLATGIWCARQETVGDLYGTNFVMGLAGSVNEALYQMTVSDLFFVHQRGTLNGLLLIFATIGNYLVPVAGGYVASGQDWRWAYWYLAIFQGVVTIVMIFFLEETKYIPDPIESIVVPIAGEGNPVSAQNGVNNDEKSEKHPLDNHLNASENGDDERRASIVSIHYTVTDDAPKRRIVEIDTSIPQRSWKRRYALWTTNGSRPSDYAWWRHLYQPFAVLFLFPAVAFAALQWAFCLSALSLIAVSSSNLFPLAPYNFSSAGVGNLNIPPAIGNILGTIWGGPLVDWTIVKLAARNAGIYEPEMRLALFPLPALLMVIGVFMYGLETAKGMPWIIPAIGSGFVGFAIGAIGDIALTYLQDSYSEILPDALIGVAFVRNIMAMILVFAIGPWFAGMGVYDAFVLLGCIAVAFMLTAVPVWIWGKRWRARCAGRYRIHAGKQFVIRSI